MRKLSRIGTFANWRISTLLLLFFPVMLQAQTLPETEAELSAMFQELKMMPARDKALEIHARIESALQKALKRPESFLYPFDSLTFLGKIYSDDNLIRIYTWNVPFHDGTFTYGCLIQQQANNKVTTLKINQSAYKPSQTRGVSAANWYGALYYKAIPVTHKKETYYTLLGWAGNDGLTSVKVIDALTLDERGTARLGLPVFKKDRAFYRIVFEYTAQATMSLDYDEKTKRIIYDHLSPSENKYAGIYSYYGPDFSYDAFLLKRGEWIYKEDIDVRNKLY